MKTVLPLIQNENGNGIPKGDSRSHNFSTDKLSNGHFYYFTDKTNIWDNKKYDIWVYVTRYLKINKEIGENIYSIWGQ